MNTSLSSDQIYQNNTTNNPNNNHYFCINDSIPEFNNKILSKLSKNPCSGSVVLKKLIKVNNNIELIPLNERYNLRYGDNYTYNDLEDNIKNIINNPKYSDKRSKSAYSKKSVKEKFQEMKLKVPKIKNWNCDPTAEIIINNLEKKVDILSHENFLLTKKLKDLLLNNKELKLNLSQKMLLLNTEKQLKNYDKDIDIYKNSNLLKIENVKLKNVIEDYKNEKDILKEKYNDLMKKYEQLKLQFDNEKYPNDNKKENIDQNSQKYYIIKNDDNEYDLLLNENEKLHNKLQKLLCIEKENNDEKNNIDINNNTDNSNNDEFVIKENKLLKEKINHLNNQLDIIKKQKNIEINSLKEKIKLFESQKIYKENEDSDNLSELDKLLNESILLYINAEDDEAKKMIATVQNIKNINKKRVSQCFIINSKLKTLIEENNFLHNQILSFKNHINNKTYDYLINELKEKDRIIDKYKNVKNTEKNAKSGFSYLIEQIVDNQKEVLGDSAPKINIINENIENNEKKENEFGSEYYYTKNEKNNNQNYNNYHYITTK